MYLTKNLSFIHIALCTAVNEPQITWIDGHNKGAESIFREGGSVKGGVAPPQELRANTHINERSALLYRLEM